MVEEIVVPLVKPGLRAQHLHIMNCADAAFLTDLSSYAGLTPMLLWSELLTLPTQVVVNRHGIT